MTLRIGIIGFGQRARMHTLLQEPALDAAVVAVCDVSERGQRSAREALPEAFVTGSLDALLDQELDAVMVLTPDDQHAEPVIRALEAGLAVFTEKPVAITLDDADRILETAYRTGSRLYVGHNMRHMPVITLMKSLIDEGRIGQVKAVWVRHFVGHGGDYYFKDWHADRARTTSLLLQKGAHDIDVIHWLAGAPSTLVTGMGDLAVYGDISDRRDRSGERMGDWFSLDNWPPATQEGLHPVVDVEDLSMVHLRLANGVLASYEQCHFTPDYWRNYTIIGTEGRIENLGDESGATVALWNRRSMGRGAADASFVVPEAPGSHGGADALLLAEFVEFAREGGQTQTSPVAARDAVAAGVLATESLRAGSEPRRVPPVPEELVAYFDAGQVRAATR